MTTSVLGALEPPLVWERFLELTRIARPPKHEEEARDHVLRWADARGLSSTVDAAGNVVVRVPATTGREHAEIVVLQSHLDMVCERDPTSLFDPRKGRINVVLEGDWVVADGTTLGADNGIGVAAAMAAADEVGFAHGPLELLFTVSEEQGLEGAKALDPSLVTGRLLLNLDGGEDGITIGCAGSVHSFTRLQLGLEGTPAGHVTLEVRLSGARGGHSGGDIAAGRINANKALGRLLARMWECSPFRVAHVEGGVSRNALPRAALAVVAVPEDAEVAIRAAAEEQLASLREQFRGTEDAVELSIEAVGGPAKSAAETTSRHLLDLVAALPSGVIAMTPELPGVVETSSSLTVVGTDDGLVTLASMTRSAKVEALEEVVDSIQAAARLAGADVELVRSYPPWRPDLDSRLLALARGTWTRVFGDDPALVVVHGGLECAILGGKVPGIEMISIGPEIEGPHAPGERLRISSTSAFYELLGALLDDLSR
jgi:dipeptidase D